MRDGILELIVKFSEMESPLESPITLIAGGFLVSGHIISKEKFIEINPITASIQEFEDKLPKEEGEPEPEDNGKRRYIHLRDAKYFSPGQPPIPSCGAVSCRFKLSDVAGFHFGYLATSSEG
jgi:methyl coenzyme M reductase gamma subunit